MFRENTIMVAYKGKLVPVQYELNDIHNYHCTISELEEVSLHVRIERDRLWDIEFLFFVWTSLKEVLQRELPEAPKAVFLDGNLEL